MNIHDITEADEQCYGKCSALTNLASIVRQGESMGVIGMYEEAALKNGATWREIELTEACARSERSPA